MQGADPLLRQLAAAKRLSLRPSDAVAALLLDDEGRYILQLRDAKDEIFYPGHWGCFGGGVEAGEEPDAALARELREELGFEVAKAARFTRFDFDFRPLGQGSMYRIYYEVVVPSSEARRFVLGEGAALKAHAAADLLSKERVVPYDAFAIWLHAFSTRRA
jgi:8-oxo-dGTP pyrophosphatase MutT (NUDIX family)